MLLHEAIEPAHNDGKSHKDLPTDRLPTMATFLDFEGAMKPPL